MQSVWCYGDLALVEWIDQAPDADASAGRRLVVSVLDVQERLVLNVQKAARKVWSVTYSRNRQPYGLLWSAAWGSPPVRGDQIEITLDDMFQPASARVLGELEGEASVLELEGEANNESKN
jgi:hypothetical protein